VKFPPLVRDMVFTTYSGYCLQWPWPFDPTI